MGAMLPALMERNGETAQTTNQQSIINMNDLNEKILQWADDKGILANGTPEGQLTKTLEELIETAQAVALYDLVAESYHFNDEDANERLESVKDGIGDVYVTICIHAEMCEYEVSHHDIVDEPIANKAIFEELGKHIITLAANDQVGWHYSIIARLLDLLAQNHRLTLRECVEHSYSVISKRTGKMIDGVFVKSK